MPECGVTSIYYDTEDAYRSGKYRRLIHQGGQWSGKTVNILVFLAMIACEQNGEFIITVTSESFPHLKKGALRDFERFVYPSFKSKIKSYHKTDHVVTFNSGAKIEFATYENEQAARGAKRNILFINEANSFDYMIFFQLDSRADFTIIDYNPTARFWSHDILEPEHDTLKIISDHRCNHFLTEERHRLVESIKDPELWRVYARGKTGNIMGVIFPEWTMIPDDDYPLEGDFFWGEDFGYTVDPTAIVKCCRKGKNIYLHQVAYQSGKIPAQRQRELLRENGYDSEQSDYCEHDEDMIRQLQLLGVTAVAARKPPGSIKAGIDKIKEYNIYFTQSSSAIIMEKSRYVWMVDKETGKLINKPIDKWNHMMDAVRYAIYTHFFRDEEEQESQQLPEDPEEEPNILEEKDPEEEIYETID